MLELFSYFGPSHDDDDDDDDVVENWPHRKSHHIHYFIYIYINFQLDENY